MRTVTLLYKKGREYWGEIVDTKLCVKINARTLYYSSDCVQLNLSRSDEDEEFFILSSDNQVILFLENDLTLKKQEYIIIDLKKGNGYRLGYFQDKAMLDFMKKFNSLSRNDIINKLELENVTSEVPKKDVFRKNIFEILGINGWEEKKISLS